MNFQINHFLHFLPIANVQKSHLEIGLGPFSHCSAMHMQLKWISLIGKTLHFELIFTYHSINQT